MNNRTLIGIGELLALAALLAAGLLVVGSAIPGAQAQDNTDLLNQSETVKDVAPGENVTVEIEFVEAGSGTVNLKYNQSQTLNFSTDAGTESLSVSAGEVAESASVEATTQEITDGNGSYFEVQELELSFPNQNGTLEDPSDVDLSASVSGVSGTAVNQSSVSGPGSSGLFGGISGENSTESLLILAVILGGLFMARNRDII